MLAASLLLASGAFQIFASFQRWLSAVGEGAIEDHSVDYFFVSDPWEPVGIAAQLFGIGAILLGAGVVVLARATAPWRGHVVAIAGVVAGLPFAGNGVHALVSGILGTPSPLQFWVWSVAVTVMQLVALVVLAVLCARRSGLSLVAVILIAGSTPYGYVFATFAVAPMIAGYQSYDTTPWTETVVAVEVALAGLLVLAGVIVRDRRSASRAASGTTAARA